ncbi:MAG: hypothetical protein ACRC4W_00395 [Treponemataceae bacterium]
MISCGDKGVVIEDFAQQITKRYGYVRRTRGSYLYTESGKRLTDMMQAQGRAILGWGFGSAKKHHKNFLDRGVIANFETRQSYRLQKVLKTFFPQCSDFYFYTSDRPLQGKKMSVWRAWDDHAFDNINDCDCVVIMPPYAWESHLFIVGCCSAQNMPPSDFIPEPVIGAITRAFYDLQMELPNRGNAEWAKFDRLFKKHWKREGAYLYPLVSETDYPDFFYYCLDNQTLISPYYSVPSIVPFFAHAGDFKFLT